MQRRWIDEIVNVGRWTKFIKVYFNIKAKDYLCQTLRVIRYEMVNVWDFHCISLYYPCILMFDKITVKSMSYKIPEEKRCKKETKSDGITICMDAYFKILS